MSCPSPERWEAVLLGEATEAERAQLFAHAQTCPACAPHAALFEALRSATPASSAAITRRALASARQGAATRQVDVRWHRWGLAVAVAAAALVTLVVLPPSTVTARGGGPSDWKKHVDAQLRPARAPTEAVAAHERVSSDVSWVVWYRNSETNRPLFVLAYLVDARGELHWIVPHYARAGVEPAPALLPVTHGARLLDSAVQPEDLAPGPAQLFTVVSPTPGAVLTFEKERALAENPLGLLPDAVVWHVGVELSPAAVPSTPRPENP